MASLYDKPVRSLMHDMVHDIELKPDAVISRDRVRSWFKERYPKIKDGTIAAHLLRMSVNSKSRVHYGAKPGEDDLFFQVDPKHFRLYQRHNDPAPIYPGDGVEQAVKEEVQELAEEGSPEFAYEKDLQNYLSKNLHLIESGLTLFEDEGINGVEFPVGGRFVDILATDSDGNYVVVELKVSKGYDRVVGQLLRYVAWIRKNQAEPGQSVRGIIVARHISEDLLLACSGVQGVQLFEYELSVSLHEARGV
ncbi:endonuclease NucS domain-containing protein [Marinobacter xiaoshiensis]|uniref:Endonuclease NucS n=1 Tax=Marinobacter xiaoshiensis TaxID=3073652 RepID=A0ABU2HJG3_9GAMM|nr:endonuclease NucS domain-containing protein [Marinobacter sp. F60267]MDS1311204.1 endonuclease NucS [Marinobacter sp. F60267]